MTYEQFWHGNPKLAKSYREANELKREHQAFAEWREGKYMQLAFASVWNSDASYPDFPLFIDDDSPTKRAYEQMKMRSNVAKVEAFMVAFNAKFQKGD